MLKPSDALWRVEFRTDLMRAGAPTLPLGYMLEAHWHDGVRWLGMLFRRKLTALELDQVETATWPELVDLESFMSGLFERSWDASEDGNNEPPLGSAIIAREYSIRSALQFAPVTNTAVINHEDAVGSFPSLYSHLPNFRQELKPSLVAEIVPFRIPAVIAPPTRDLELTNRAA